MRQFLILVIFILSVYIINAQVYNSINDAKSKGEIGVVSYSVVLKSIPLNGEMIFDASFTKLTSLTFDGDFSLDQITSTDFLKLTNLKRLTFKAIQSFLYQFPVPDNLRYLKIENTQFESFDFGMILNTPNSSLDSLVLVDNLKLNLVNLIPYDRTLKYIEIKNNFIGGSNICDIENLSYHNQSLETFVVDNFFRLQKFPDFGDVSYLLLKTLIIKNCEVLQDTLKENILLNENLKYLDISYNSLNTSNLNLEYISNLNRIIYFDATNQRSTYTEAFIPNIAEGGIIDTLPNMVTLKSTLGYSSPSELFELVKDTMGNGGVVNILKAKNQLVTDKIYTNVVTFNHSIFGDFTLIYNEAKPPEGDNEFDLRLSLKPKQVEKIVISLPSNLKESEIPYEGIFFTDSVKVFPGNYSASDHKVIWNVISGANLLSINTSGEEVFKIKFKENSRGTIKIQAQFIADSSYVKSNIEAIDFGFAPPDSIHVKNIYGTTRSTIIDGEDTLFVPTFLLPIDTVNLLVGGRYNLTLAVFPKPPILATYTQDSLEFRCISEDANKLVVERWFNFTEDENDTVVSFRLHSVKAGFCKINIVKTKDNSLVYTSVLFNILEKEKVVIAPNPITEQDEKFIYIFFETNERRVAYIYDSYGRIRKRFVFDSETATVVDDMFRVKIDLFDYKSGMYYLRILRGNDITDFTQPFVIE